MKSVLAARPGLALGLLSLVSVLACGGGGVQREVGAIRVTAVTASKFTSGTVRITVSAPDMAAPVTATLTQSGAVWSGTVGPIPAGDGRVVLAEAFDAGSVLRYSGSAGGVLVTAGGTSLVTVVAQQVGAPPPPPGNVPPFIDAVVASTATVAAGGSVALTVTAHDPDAGSVLAYEWTATAGAFDDPAAAGPTWTAPGAAGAPTLTITVRDEKGASASVSFDLAVEAPPPPPPTSGTVDATIAFNDRPVVESVAVSPSRVTPGEAATAAAVATDADADPLSYAWTASCAGTFGAAAATTTFTPAAGVSGLCTLQVEVADGRGGVASGTSGLWVEPPATVTVAPPPPPPATCEGTFAASPDPMAGHYICANAGTTAAAPLSLSLNRLFFGFDVLDGANGGDGRLPRFTFDAVPTAGTTYALADLAKFSAVVWWTKVGVDDLYIYVAGLNDLGLGGSPVGTGSVTVSTVTELPAGGYEIHGSYDVQLEPRPGVIFDLDPRFDDPLAKLPTDCTGSIHLVGTF